MRSIRTFVRPSWGLGVLCVLVFFTSLGATRFWDEDEGFFASTAAEMYARGDWIVPWFNDKLFGHKPPWMYWGMMAGFSAFGVNEFGARFASAVSGTATVLVTYWLGARLFGRRAGWLAGLALATSLLFAVVSRAAVSDSHLVLFSTAAMCLFVADALWKRPDGEDVREHKRAGLATNGKGAVVDLVPHGRGSIYAAMYAVMGLGALTKGPIGFVVPMAVIGLYLLCTTPRREVGPAASKLRRAIEWIRPFGPFNFFRCLWRMRPLTAAAMILAVAGPWYVAVGMRTDGEFLRQFFGVHHFHRFNAAMEGHSGPFWYYVPALLVGLFPWSIFAAPLIAMWIGSLREPREDSRGVVFLTCWIAVWLALFSLAGTKLPHYVLPVYPALALLIGRLLDRWIESPASIAAGWRHAVFGSMTLVGFGMAAGLPLAGAIRFDGSTLLDRAGLMPDVQRELILIGMVGAPLIVGGIAAWILAGRNATRGAVVSTAAASIAFMLALWNFAAPRVDRFQGPQELAREIRMERDGRSPSIVTYRFFRPSMVYYFGRPVAACNQAHEIRQAFEQDAAAHVIVQAEHLDELRNVLPADAEIVARRSRFPEKGELVVLARRAVASRATSSSSSLR